MSIKARIDEAAQRIGLRHPPIPGSAVTVQAGQLVERMLTSGSSWVIFCRLVEAHDTRPRAVEGRWPLVRTFTYVAKGEDDQPTLYITAEDDPAGVFCVPMDGWVTLVPPPGGPTFL